MFLTGLELESFMEYELESVALCERRRGQKTILYYKIVNGHVPSYLGQELPQLVSESNPYHRRHRHGGLVVKASAS